jgi:uncharacterized DUF497 family protein
MATVVYGDFEWDEEKSEECFKRWNFDFVFASRLFSRPDYLEDFDEDHSNDETRWTCIGYAVDVLLRIVYTERGRRKRILSARPALIREQDRYVKAYGRQTNGTSCTREGPFDESG